MTNKLWRTLTAILLGIGTVTFSGCTSDPTSDGTGSEEYILLNFSKNDTRADISDDGSGSFSEGDVIGLYLDNGSRIEYRELRYESGQWQPRLRRPDFGEGRLTLSAHYPVVKGESDVAAGSYRFSVATDQSGDGFEASDLLVSQAVLEAGNNRADLVFRHAMHRLRIELTGKTDGAEVTVCSRVGGIVDLLTGEATPTDQEFQWITPARNADGSFEAVIYPQDAAPYRDGDGSLLKITAADKEYSFKAPDMQTDGNDLKAFEAGRQVTVRLSLKESADSKWANRKVWVYGIKAPEESAWVQLYPEFYHTYYLPCDPSYGWYDCNKVNPTANPDGVPDGMMCWAAADASMLHWWFDQNRKYIEMYGDRYKGPDYHFPQPKRQESDIFQCFIDSFVDEAGYTDAGVNWFIHGKIPSAPARDKPYNDAGYFKDVFPEGVLLGKNIGGLSKERFNETIKDALENKKAIAISRGTVRSGHILTVWGAEFDENGNVSYVYMADNNDRDQFEAWGVGCIRSQIVYERYPEGATYTCYKSGYIENNKSIVINRLATLELGDTYWEQYFASAKNKE